MAFSLEEAVRRIQSGDREAAAWLYDEFATLLLRRLESRYSYLSHSDLEDLLHDTFLLALRDDSRLLRAFVERAPPSEREPAALGRYLWDLACGLVTNRRRAVAFRSASPLPEPDEIAAAGALETLVLQRDLLARLDACLAGTDSRLYLYFQLRFVDGLTPEEIALATGWERKATYKLRETLNAAVRECCRQLGMDVT